MGRATLSRISSDSGAGHVLAPLVEHTMGTRSLTVLKDMDGKEICVMYRQFDGYPTGHGKALAKFLSGFKVVNGIPLDPETQARTKLANGAECLAAQVIAHFKSGYSDAKHHAGGIYLHAAGTRDCGEEYIYTVQVVNADAGTERDGFRARYFINLKCETPDGRVLFDDTPEEFDGAKIENEDEA